MYPHAVPFISSLCLCSRGSDLWHHVSGLLLHLPPAEPQEAGHVQRRQPLPLPGKTKSYFLLPIIEISVALLTVRIWRIFLH